LFQHGVAQYVVTRRKLYLQLGSKPVIILALFTSRLRFASGGVTSRNRWIHTLCI